MMIAAPSVPPTGSPGRLLLVHRSKLCSRVLGSSILLLHFVTTLAWQNLVPPFKWSQLSSTLQTAVTRRSSTSAVVQLEDQLLNAIANVNQRLNNDDTIEALVRELESNHHPSITEPAIASQIYGTWRLLYTTAATTSSPIQRRAVNAQQFPIFQDIVVVPSSSNQYNSPPVDRLIVKQIVKFSDNIILSVDALASTAVYPLEELQPRKSTGEILGWNVLGVSLVGDAAQPNVNRPNSRIDFVFDEGNFMIGKNIKIPYPVPFRLPFFRDWVKGWIDITYLSDRIRISRGNKGTTFVLIKEDIDQ
jgi:hypothetical protein